MKTLRNHVILYDSECPMCNLYTQAFVHTGMLNYDGRVSYQTVPEALCPLVDMQRAVNEIALVNTQTGEVSYGIISLFIVIGNSFPMFKRLFEFGPFVWLMTKAYSFVSYNRRVIAPAPANGVDLLPAFKFKYRVLYLLFTWLVVGFILTRYAHLLLGAIPIGNCFREYWICGGQIIFQGLVVLSYQPNKKWDYLGNMMTISLAGALFLVPAFLVNMLFELSPIVYISYFLTVAGLMLLEHIRRTRILNFSIGLTMSWVFYRLIILLLILNF